MQEEKLRSINENKIKRGILVIVKLFTLRKNY